MAWKQNKILDKRTLCRRGLSRTCESNFKVNRSYGITGGGPRRAVNLVGLIGDVKRRPFTSTQRRSGGCLIIIYNCVVDGYVCRIRNEQIITGFPSSAWNRRAALRRCSIGVSLMAPCDVGGQQNGRWSVRQTVRCC